MVTRSEPLLERSEPGYTFDFCGGHVAVDFTNTVGSRVTEPDEHLGTFADLLAWAEARRVISRAEASKLKRAAAHDLAGARRALTRALDLREALYAVLGAIADRRRPDASALARLNTHVAQTFSTAHLAIGDGRASLETAGADPLDAVAAAVVRSAVDLLTSDGVQRIGRCADDTCGWIFFDTTRSGTRRWCDMKSCGNRNKVRRFRST
jgi:predicted RNA-binding Zn ribbon-like protein